MQEGKKVDAPAAAPMSGEQLSMIAILKAVTEIALCRVIRKSGLEEEYGKVWRSRKMPPGLPAMVPGMFLMGFGIKPKPDLELLYFMLPMKFWDDCYFAREIDAAPILPNANAPATQADAIKMVVDLINKL